MTNNLRLMAQLSECVVNDVAATAELQSHTPATTFERCSPEPLKCCRPNAPLIQMMGKVCSCCCDFNGGKAPTFLDMWVSSFYPKPSGCYRNGEETGPSVGGRGKPFIVNRLGHL